jgi:hypothetical protein
MTAHPTVRLTNGGVVYLQVLAPPLRHPTATGPDTLVIVDHPDAPPDMRHKEAGRIVDGGFQPAPLAAFALRPETLRAIATLIEGEQR